MTTTLTPASEKQIAFATSLGKEIAERDLNEEQRTELQTVRNIWPELLRNGKAMSAIIDMLIELKNNSLPPRREASSAPAAPEGMHKLGDDIYKVQLAVHGSGRPYAKRLILMTTNLVDVTEGAEPTYTAVFDIAPGVVRQLSEATLMPLEEAKAFGALYGVCCVCGRTLTDEGSIEAGIGPICASKF